MNRARTWNGSLLPENGIRWLRCQGEDGGRTAQPRAGGLDALDQAHRRGAGRHEDMDAGPQHVFDLDGIATRDGGDDHRTGIGGAVEFVSGISDERLVELYASSQVAVVPSLYEGFSLPAVEAMASGTPLVATTGGALPEVVGADGREVRAGPRECPVPAGGPEDDKLGPPTQMGIVQRIDGAEK